MRALLKRFHHSDGWTLAELLIIVALIAILLMLFLAINWRAQINRANDSKRKTDLDILRKAFENYNGDKETYPPTDILSDCGGNELGPFLQSIPCDPTRRTPYLYVPVDETDLRKGYRICAQLQDLTDPDIISQGCHPVNGCGWGAGWNYCLTSGASVTPPGFNPNLAPTPTPTPTPSYAGPYACAPGLVVGGIVIVSGSCNNYADPGSSGCPESWAESGCQGNCGNPVYWCAR